MNSDEMNSAEKIPSSLPENFRSKFTINDETGCWNWVAGKNKKGYGRFRFGGSDENGGKSWYSHIFSYAVINGRNPDGTVLDHLCRNYSCVNPEHLEAVSLVENLVRSHGHNRRSKESLKPLPTFLPSSFISKVSIDTNGCWIWIGGKDKKGTCKFRYGGSDKSGGRVWGAHVFAYRVMFGPFDEMFIVDRVCGKLDCVSPDHLQLLTQQENIRQTDYGNLRNNKESSAKEDAQNSRFKQSDELTKIVSDLSGGLISKEEFLELSMRILET